MRDHESTIASLLVAVVLAGSVTLSVHRNPLSALAGITAHAAESDSKVAPAAAPKPLWAASATGRVEPREGFTLIGTPVPGRIADVAVKANDKVVAGDMLVRLEEDDALTRVTAAAIEVQIRERERDEEVAKGLQLERRQAEDSVASAERALYRARLAFDEIVFKARMKTASTGADIDKARFQIAAAREQLTGSRASLARVLSKESVPLSTRLEASLATARADLSMAEAAVERTRIRAPANGVVLQLTARFGEIVAPSPDATLVVLGDVSALRVKAEIEERDATVIRIGQKAIVKGDAYPGQEFSGVVTTIAQTMASPRIQARGIRRPTDIEVLEVMVALDGTPPLLTGMRVDVFFTADAAAKSTAAAN